MIDMDHAKCGAKEEDAEYHRKCKEERDEVTSEKPTL